MDGQQRLLLEQSWETLSSIAEFNPATAKSTAVVVGIGTVEYNTISAHLGNGIYVATGKPCYTQCLGLRDKSDSPLGIIDSHLPKMQSADQIKLQSFCRQIDTVGES